MAEPKHTYKFNVTMTCSGCSGAVGRKLRKLNGVRSHFEDLHTQTVTVETEPSVSFNAVLTAIQDTGKVVNSGEADGNVQVLPKAT